ncbi:MAG: hypothetical protein ACPG6V_00935 [Flavobacteriales bacterium]
MGLIESQFLKLSERLKYFALKHQKLQRLLERKNHEFDDLKDQFERQTEELNALKEKYNRIKVAKSVTELGDDPVKVRKKVNELIRGIDKCIARLNK